MTGLGQSRRCSNAWAVGDSLYLVERVTESAHEPLGTFGTLAEALAAVDGEPEATCFRCGRSVVPGNQWPDADLPCPK